MHAPRSPAEALVARAAPHENGRPGRGLAPPAAHGGSALTSLLVATLTACHYPRQGISPIVALTIPPPARSITHTDDDHGVKIADPYRWLEDDHSTETKAWVEAQNKVTFSYLEQIPQRAALKARLTELWNYERHGIPFQQGGRYFIAKNDGLQNQSVLCTMIFPGHRFRGRGAPPDAWE